MKKIFFIIFLFLYFSNLNAEINFNYYLNKAIENNLQLNAERKNLESAKQSKNISRSEFLPSITFLETSHLQFLLIERIKVDKV